MNKLSLKLQDSEYVGCYLRTDWNNIIDQLNNSAEHLFNNTPAEPLDWATNPIYENMYSTWIQNNFNPNSIKWSRYTPGYHFDSSLVDDIASYLKLTSIGAFWISRIDPGFFAPIHCDPFIKDKTDLEKGEAKRYLITMAPADAGQIFILGQDHLYNLPVGTVIKWNDPNELHIGINGSMQSKYLINVIGY